MEKFEYYLMGKRFRVITDHKVIEELKSKLEFGSSRIRRWFERIEKFDFEVVYRKGEDMIVTDSLSRSPQFYEGEEGVYYEDDKKLWKNI